MTALNYRTGTVRQWAVISAAGVVLLASFERDEAAEWARLAPNGATLQERTVTFTEWTPAA